MTYKEAIFFAEKIKENGVISESFKLLEDGTVFEHSITKLSEEGINMIELAIEAMELQVAKKIEIKLVEKDRTACCPICGNLLSTYYRLKTCNYCEICGNKLDWSVE